MDNLNNLVKKLSKLPTFGPRSSRRFVLHLLQHKDTLMESLIEDMTLVKDKTKTCNVCGNLDITEVCSICTDPKRDNKMICVVEDVSDIWALEKNKIFNGKYHVLGGVLSAILGKTLEDLNINSLIERVKNNNVEEVIIAINPTIDGITTSYYLSEILQEFNIKISKLANGIPIGSELDYLDEGTISIAFKAREKFN
jgi:recombination protein RecR|tara:strand:- start:24139 stop:24729 length:591 start_codon:yes stop_codon:yes gene_type:complete